MKKQKKGFDLFAVFDVVFGCFSVLFRGDKEYDYINFLTAAPKVFGCTEAEKIQPDRECGPSHDPINRLLYRLPSGTEALRREAAPHRQGRFLISDDSASDKPWNAGHDRQWFADRPVNSDGKGSAALSEAGISESGSRVRLKGYGSVRVSGIVAKDGGAGYRAASDPDTDGLGCLQVSDFSWKIGEYRRGFKQFCWAERAFVRPAEAQRNHIGLAIRAFLRFEVFSLKTGISRSEAEIRIIRDAIRAYLRNPIYDLCPTA